jgi:8-amino-3,8-dideoxy-alpha-D-manno-octulosonate transaminase
VYNNMENVLNKRVPTPDGCPFSCPHYSGGTVEYRKGMLPHTDAILKRAVNVSIGVVDAGLGTGFGISIESTDDEIDRTIERFRRSVRECCG